MECCVRGFFVEVLGLVGRFQDLGFRSIRFAEHVLFGSRI